MRAEVAGNRGHVSLYRRNACEVGLEFNFVDMPVVKTCDVSRGFLVAGGLMSSYVGVISQAVVAFPPSFLCAVNKYIYSRNRSHFFIFTSHLFLAVR